MAPGKFDQITADAYNLMRTDCWFRENAKGPMQDDSKPVSISYIIAAFCCVWYSLKDSTNFKPYWHGQPSQGGSINASNKVSIFDIDPAIDSVPEEHRHIWVYRLEWFVDALRGHRELKEQKFAFRSAMANMVLDICNTNNTDCFAQVRASFDEYISKRLP